MPSALTGRWGVETGESPEAPKDPALNEVQSVQMTHCGLWGGELQVWAQNPLSSYVQYPCVHSSLSSSGALEMVVLRGHDYLAS